MTESQDGAWTGPEAALAAHERMLALEQQLRLVDRVRSLEAQLAQLSPGIPVAPSEQLNAEQQLLAFRASLPWRVGRLVTYPVRVAQRAVRPRSQP